MDDLNLALCAAFNRLQLFIAQGKGVPENEVPTVPDVFKDELEKAGYVIVPKEPTDDMVAAGDLELFTHDHLPDVYKAMIAARPNGEV